MPDHAKPALPSRVNLNHLPAFLAVAGSGSFRAAAAQLHVSQSALSIQIRQFEEVLGVPLFHRTTRSVALTREGQRLLPVARRLCEDVAQIAQDFRDEAELQRGVVTIVTLPSLAAAVAPRLLRGFAAHSPGIRIGLRDLDSRLAVEALDRGEADLGLLSHNPRLQQHRFVALMDDELLAVVPASGHALSERRRLRLRDLLAHPLLLNPRGVDLRETVEARFTQQGLVPAPAQELVGSHALVALVAAGQGVSILPRLALATARMEGCRAIRLLDGGSRQLGLVVPKGRSLSPAAQAFIDFATAQEKELPKELCRATSDPRERTRSLSAGQ